MTARPASPARSASPPVSVINGRFGRSGPAKPSVDHRRLSRLRGLLAVGALRAFLLVCGAGALLLPLPPHAGPSAALAFSASAFPLLAVWRPGGPWPGCVLVFSVVEWVVTSLLDGPPPARLTVALGVVLYLVHTTAAFAAALPGTAHVEMAVLLRWAGRTAAVLLVSVPVMALALTVRPLPGSLLFALLGVAAGIGVAVVLVALLLRRQPE